MTTPFRLVWAQAVALPIPGCPEGEPDTPDAEETTGPYDVYVENAPAGEPVLSREDAQTRALLGCGQSWAPGTVDAVLAEAYADLCT